MQSTTELMSPQEIQEVARNLVNWAKDETDSLPGSLPGSQGPIEVDNSSIASSKEVSSKSYIPMSGPFNSLNILTYLGRILRQIFI